MGSSATRDPLLDPKQIGQAAGKSNILQLRAVGDAPGGAARPSTAHAGAARTPSPRPGAATAKTLPGEYNAKLFADMFAQVSHMFVPLHAALSLEARVAGLEADRSSRRERPAAPAERARWADFLVTSTGDPALPQAQRAAILDTWQLIIEREPAVMYPTAGVDEETRDFYFSWSRAERALEVQVARDGSVSWFFADHTTSFSASSDEAAPRGFLTFVTQFLRGR